MDNDRLYQGNSIYIEKGKMGTCLKYGGETLVARSHLINLMQHHALFQPTLYIDTNSHISIVKDEIPDWKWSLKLFIIGEEAIARASTTEKSFWHLSRTRYQSRYK
jgi:hypothetical protein